MYEWQHDTMYGACMTELLFVFSKRLLASHYPEQLKDSDGPVVACASSPYLTEFYACGHLTNTADWKIFNLQEEP